MSGYLIKDTTVEERINLIKSWQEPEDCVGGSGIDLFDMYDEYIKGKKEISEINQEFHANYIKGDADREEEETSTSCAEVTMPAGASSANTPSKEKEASPVAPAGTSSANTSTKATEPSSVTPATSGQVTSVSDEIGKLKTMLDQGILTDEEFTAAKKKVLGL
ncbi:MAG: SHOCT domain-containing protein [Roseburia sp.]